MGRVTISSNNLFPGPKGEKGDQGDPGGPAGPAGPAGTTGPQGPQGPQGIQGTQGNPGAQGAEGPIGSTGLKGDKGDKGDTGATGSTGATGAKGDTGDQGPSGVVTVNAPLTNAGTSSAANLSISAGTTSAAGALQLTDSVASTSTTTAATPNAVKTAYDFADTKLLKYATPWQVKYRSGYYYESKNGAQIITSLFTISRMLCVPVFISESITIDRIGAECVTAVASSTFRLGIYTSDSNGLPANLVLDAGTIDTSTTGAKTITISQTLTPGLYYLTGCQQGGATNATMRGYHNIMGNHSPVAGATMSTTVYYTGFNQDPVTGAFPSTYTGNNPNTLQQPRIQFRVA
jgi:hypothetical protein